MMQNIVTANTNVQEETRWFYVGIAVLLIVLSVIGFTPDILWAEKRNVPLPMNFLVALHGIISVAWLLTFLAQALLVAKDRVATHRQLGICGTILAVAFVITGCMTIVGQARRGFDLSGNLVPRGTILNPAQGLILITMFPLFAVLVGAAIWYRRRPAIHKRMIALAMLGPVAGSPIGHIVGHWPVLQSHSALLGPLIPAVLLSLPALQDRWSEGRIHKVSLWGGISVWLYMGLCFAALVSSSIWREFADWVIR